MRIEVGEIEYWAALGRKERVLECLLAGEDVIAQSEGGSTALHVAALNGHLEVLNLLIENGATLGICLVTGETALDLAEFAGHQVIADTLKSAMMKPN